MNKNRQRTLELMQAVARRRMAEQANNAIEQARFNRLVAQGFICVDPILWLDNMIQSRGGASEKALPPKVPYTALSTTYP